MLGRRLVFKTSPEPLRTPARSRVGHLAGFSLIEVTIVVLILGVLAVGAGMITNPVMSLWRIQAFQQGPLLEGRLALMRIERDINSIRDRTSVSTAGGSGLSPRGSRFPGPRHAQRHDSRIRGEGRHPAR